MDLFKFFFHFLFILYYSYVLFVFSKLYKNSCSCKKLEQFKNTWNFKTIMILTPILWIFTFYLMIKTMVYQKGGSNHLYYNVLFTITIGFSISFLNDFAILHLFHIMKKKQCPCQEKHRKLLNNLTYVKVGVNILLYFCIISNFDKKLLNKIIKKMKKNKTIK